MSRRFVCLSERALYCAARVLDGLVQNATDNIFLTRGRKVLADHVDKFSGAPNGANNRRRRATGNGGICSLFEPDSDGAVGLHGRIINVKNSARIRTAVYLSRPAEDVANGSRVPRRIDDCRIARSRAPQARQELLHASGCFRQRGQASPRAPEATSQEGENVLPDTLQVYLLTEYFSWFRVHSRHRPGNTFADVILQARDMAGKVKRQPGGPGSQVTRGSRHRANGRAHGLVGEIGDICHDLAKTP